MESILRKLKVGIEDYKVGTITEVFITNGDKQAGTEDIELYLNIQSLNDNDSPKYITIKKSEFNDYFEQEAGLDKVYSEYRAKVSRDLLKSCGRNCKETIKIDVITLFFLLAIACTAAILGGAVGIVLVITSIVTLITFLVAMNSRSKRRLKLGDYCMQERRLTRKHELIHMLTNLGYIETKK